MQFTLKLCAAALCLAVGVTHNARAGAVLHLYYDGIPGATVQDLTGSAIFPDFPTASEPLIAALEKVPFGNFDDFGAWTRGYIEAPQTGAYTFWIASDDDSQLWLSTDHTPANKVKIAENLGAVGLRNYTAKTAQQSAAISLVQGQKYYFEVLHKESGGLDHLSVAWRLPDGSFQGPIPGVRLMPFAVDGAFAPIEKAPEILSIFQGVPVPALEAITVVEEGRLTALAITVEASQPATIRWFRNGTELPGANLSTYEIANTGLAENNVEYTVSVSNHLGVAAASTTLSVTPDTEAPTILAAAQTGSSLHTIAVVFSEAVDAVSATTAGNYQLGGVSVSGAIMGSTPDTVLLRTSALTPGTAYALTVNNVKDIASAQNTIAPGASVLVNEGLKVWLRFDETSGTVAADSSVNGNHADLVGAPTLGLAGRVNRAVALDGFDDHAQLPTSGFEDFSGGLTLMVWANPTANANWSRFIEFGNGAANNNILFARNGTTANLTFEVRVGAATGGQVTANSAIETGRWQHFAATLDSAGNVRLYRNGQLAAQGTTGVPEIATRTNNYVGRSNWSTDGYYRGRMDDVRVYQGVLDESVIRAIVIGDTEHPAINIVATQPFAHEDGSQAGVFTVTRTGSTAAPLTVSYTVSGTATPGADYTVLPGTITIPAGTNAAVIPLIPINDMIVDPHESVILTLSGSTDYNVDNPDNATVTIVDDDDVSPPAVVAAIVENALPAFNFDRLEVWFDEPVVSPGLFDLANYSLSGTSVTITNVTARNNKSLGVVLHLSGPLAGHELLNVSGIQDLSGNVRPLTAYPVRARLHPFNVIANNFNSPNVRADCFNMSIDGVINPVNASGWDTFTSVNATNYTDYVGLIYANETEFETIKVDLGQQFGDGGSWEAQPRVFILTTHTDPGAPPELDPAIWREVSAALVSGSEFDTIGDGNPSPNSPVVFDLSHLAPELRRGYGWAVGGVRGDNTLTFVSVVELRAYGVAGADQAVTISTAPQSVSVEENKEATFSVVASGTWPVTYQWRRNGFDIPGATGRSYTTPPAQLSEDGDQFDVQITNPLGTVPSSVAILSVQPDATPPLARVATLDTAVEIWFNELIATNHATNIWQYVFSDPGMAITQVSMIGRGTGVRISGTGAFTDPSVTVAISDVQDLAGNVIASTNLVLQRKATPINVLANNYNSANQAPGGRVGALLMADNGIVGNADVDEWNTWMQRDQGSRFVGLLYEEAIAFSAIKVDVGRQFVDGGNWAEQPRVYILKNAVDTDRARPEFDTNWVEVAAHLVSGAKFDPALDGATGVLTPNTPITFDLGHLPLNTRAGFGWAVGGVPGDGPAIFVSVSELRGYGVPLSSPLAPALKIERSGANVVISWPAHAEGYVLHSSDSLISPSWTAVAGDTEIAGDQIQMTLSIGNQSIFFRLIK